MAPEAFAFPLGEEMVEEVPDSKRIAPGTEETQPPNVEETQVTNQATIESMAQGGTESSCSTAQTSALLSVADRDKSLEHAAELMARGSTALKECDFSEATECFSRALEIRVAHYGELAFECVNAYYKYGCALLYKAQEEADPLGAVPKKDGESQQESHKEGSLRDAVNSDSRTAFASITAEDGSSSHQKGGPDDASTEKDQEEDEEESDVDDLVEADEDESDLDLAWKMLDVARAILEKHSVSSMEKVDVLSALAEVALEREDIDTSLSDYLNALSILEQLVEPDNRRIAELNFRICLCLEVGSRAEEAIPYCQKAISVCKSRVERLVNESKSIAVVAPETDQTVEQSSIGSSSVSDKNEEVETLTGLASELEKKLEDLQQLVTNPTSILSEIMGMVSARARGINVKIESSAVMSSSEMGTVTSNGGFDSPTVSTAHTNGAATGAGVTNLGVVGRGVKRVSMGSATVDSSSIKKPAFDSSQGKGDDGSSS